jgi:hypothetical protein
VLVPTTRNSVPSQFNTELADNVANAAGVAAVDTTVHDFDPAAAKSIEAISRHAPADPIRDWISATAVDPPVPENVASNVTRVIPSRLSIAEKACAVIAVVIVSAIKL